MALQRTECLPEPWEEGDYLLERGGMCLVIK